MKTVKIKRTHVHHPFLYSVSYLAYLNGMHREISFVVIFNLNLQLQTDTFVLNRCGDIL